jgi:hypothetical protein
MAEDDEGDDYWEDDDEDGLAWPKDAQHDENEFGVPYDAGTHVVRTYTVNVLNYFVNANIRIQSPILSRRMLTPRAFLPMDKQQRVTQHIGEHVMHLLRVTVTALVT